LVGGIIYAIFAGDMSSRDKLIERFKRLPKDFTFDEFVKLMSYVGFSPDNKGKTSGSRIRFTDGERFYNMHKPHPGSILKESALKSAYNYLKQQNLI